MAVRKKLDFVSPRLAALAASGRTCPLVLIDFVDQVACAEFLVERISLKNVVIDSASIDSSTHLQSVTLNYEQIAWQYHEVPRPKLLSTPGAVSRLATRL